MKKFLLVDDHDVVRSGIKNLLNEIYAPAEVHEAIDGTSTLDAIKANNYDLVILDIQMPDTDTLGLVKVIHHQYPDTKVLIFSMGAESIFAKRFMKAGARGFISKDAPLSNLTHAINTVLEGKNYLSEKMLNKIAEESINGNPLNPFDRLSPKEFEIVMLLLSGKSVGDISSMLNLHTSTVGTHKARLFEKLEVSNLMDLSKMAKAYELE
jgi:two-component system invasion response regulator UvrY